jgi:serine/threonine protein kinase
MRLLRETDGREITLEGPLLGRGGEASVYAVPDSPTLAAKIYHNPTVEQADKLKAMLATPAGPPAGGDPALVIVHPCAPGRAAHAGIAWPIERLLEADAERRVVGYLMPRVERGALLWEVYNPGARLPIYPQFHPGSLVRTARNLACVVHRLHRSGYVIGDLNESNVLVTPEARVTLIDADSFQVPSATRLYRCGVGRPEYAPPELQGIPFVEVDRRPEHDVFALGVLIFQLLMQGVHPFAGVSVEGGEPGAIPARIRAGAWPYAWSRPVPLRPSPHAPPWCVLPPPVQELLRCCFEDAHATPALRPSAAQWQEALEEAENNLTTCPRNRQHRHARGLDVCPWCVLAKQQGRDPFPAPGEAQARREAPRRAVPTRLASRGTPAPGVLREDPRPAPPAPPPVAVKKPGWVEAGLRRVGAALGRHGWAAWLGAILVGSVAGLLWALEHRPVPTPQEQPPPGPGRPGVALPPVAAPREERPAPVPPPRAPQTVPRPGNASALPPTVAREPKNQPVMPPVPPPLRPPDAPVRKSEQEAREEFNLAREAYLNAFLAYQEAVTSRAEGMSKEEIQRRYLRFQEVQRRLQTAVQRLVQEATNRR